MSQQNALNSTRNAPNGNTPSKKKKKRPKFKLSSVFFIFFIVYIASFFAYMVQANTTSEIPTKEDSVFNSSNKSSDDEDGTADTSEEVTSAGDDDTVMAMANPVPESDAVDEEYLNSCIFVGDSISEGFSGYFFLDEANVLAKQGLRPDNVDETPVTNDTYGGEVLAIDGIVQSGFKNIYIMLGSNGIGWVDNDKMVEGYKNFINEIKEQVEDANIYVISVPPVTAKREDTSEYETIEDGLVLNSSIDELNRDYLEMANELNVHYLDINSYLKDETGKLPYDSSADGMHFDSATYQKVLDYVCSHIAE
jgi:hypothetical protein